MAMLNNQSVPPIIGHLLLTLAKYDHSQWLVTIPHEKNVKIPRHVTSPLFLGKTLERIPPKSINIMSLVVMFMHKYQTSAVWQPETGPKMAWHLEVHRRLPACSSWISPHPQMLKQYLAPIHNLRGCACQFVSSHTLSLIIYTCTYKLT